MSDYDYRSSIPRENLMQQRLRKARGELVEDDFDEPDWDVDLSRAFDYRGGCAQRTLYSALGVLATLLIGMFIVNQLTGGAIRPFQLPDLRQLMATPTPAVIPSSAVVQRIQSLSRLETATYTVQTVIEVNQSHGNPLFDFFVGDALLLIAHGSVSAGVDLGTITSNEVSISPDGRTITIQLPPAQIFRVDLDNQKTRVYSRTRGWFAPENKDLETLARQQAEGQILQAACEDGILSKATNQAQMSLRQFLGLINDAEIVILPGSLAECPTLDSLP